MLPGLLLALAVAACGGNSGPSGVDQTDPCILAQRSFPTDLPQTGDTRFVHDPEVIKDGDDYYVLSTNDGIPIRRSDDLLEWELLGRVFPDQLPPWGASTIPGTQAPWAPGLAYFDGEYHLYYSLSTFGSQRSAIGLATTPTLDPAGPDYGWEDHGPVLQSFVGDDYNAIDAAVVEDDAGGLWIAWGSWWNGLYMRALDRSTGMLSTDDTTLHHLANRPQEDAIEGPYIVKRGDYYYLFAAFDLCCRGVESTYNVRVGRSARGTGPYVDRHGDDMRYGGGSRVVTGYEEIYGPGHGSVLAEGDDYYLVNHFYWGGDNGAPHLQVRPLLWDDEGWPLAGLPYDGTPPGPPPPDVRIAGDWAYWVAAAVPTVVELREDGTALACDGSGTWSYESPMLTIRWDSIGRLGQPRTDRSVLSADGSSLVGRTPADQIVRAYRLSED